MNLKDLKKEIPYKWRIQTVNSYKGTADCVAYIDSRDAEDLLDEVIGELYWKDEYRRDSHGILICRLSIYNESIKEWIYKEDCGTAKDFEKDKSEYSDAFKRAAVKFGIGRFLYKKDIQTIHVKIYKNKKNKQITLPLDKKGNVLSTTELTAYIEECIKNGEPTYDKKLQTMKSTNTDNGNNVANENIVYLSGYDTYKLKEDLKKIGGKFDPNSKKWYIPESKVKTIKSWNSNIVIEGYNEKSDKEITLDSIKFDGYEYYEKEIANLFSNNQSSKIIDLDKTNQTKALAWLKILSNIDNPENRQKIFESQMELAQFVVDHQDINTLYKTTSHLLKDEGFKHIYEVDNIDTIKKIIDELKDEYSIS